MDVQLRTLPISNPRVFILSFFKKSGLDKPVAFFILAQHFQDRSQKTTKQTKTKTKTKNNKTKQNKKQLNLCDGLVIGC